MPEPWTVLAAVFAAVFMVAVRVAAAPVAYPEGIYPFQVLDARRTAEVPFAETSDVH